MELDLTEAIEAGMKSTAPVPQVRIPEVVTAARLRWVTGVVEAAAPIIERQVRAATIREIAERCFYDGDTDQPLPGYYELLDEADEIARGER